jgi:hypothetical protein
MGKVGPFGTRYKHFSRHAFLFPKVAILPAFIILVREEIKISDEDDFGVQVEG